jgi:hypothetical protein
MNVAIRTSLENIYSADRELQNKAFFDLIEATEQPVDWAYDAWDGLLAALRHPDNHVRAIAAQVLCGLQERPGGQAAQGFGRADCRHPGHALSPPGMPCSRCGRWALPASRSVKLVEGLSGRFAECITKRTAP